MTYQTEAQRGDEAAQLLENPAFQEAMARLRAEVTRQWKASSLRDTDGQRLLLQLARVTDDFENILRGMVEAGKFAQGKLEEEKARRERAVNLDRHRNESGARSFIRRVVSR